MDLFLNKLKSGCFTKCKEKEIELEKKLYDHFILNHFKEIFSNLKITKQSQETTQNSVTSIQQQIQSLKRKNQ